MYGWSKLIRPQKIQVFVNSGKGGDRATMPSLWLLVAALVVTVVSGDQVFTTGGANCSGSVKGFQNESETVPTPGSCVAQVNITDFVHGIQCGLERGGVAGACVGDLFRFSVPFRFQSPIYEAGPCDDSILVTLPTGCLFVNRAPLPSLPAASAAPVATELPFSSSEGVPSPMGPATPLSSGYSRIVTVNTNETKSALHLNALSDPSLRLARIEIRSTLIIIVTEKNEPFYNISRWEGLGSHDESGAPTSLERRPKELFASSKLFPVERESSARHILSSCHMQADGQTVVSFYAAQEDGANATLLWSSSYAIPVSRRVAVESNSLPETVLEAPWRIKYICFTFESFVFNAADLNHDDMVSLPDLLVLFETWGTPVNDLTGDGTVDLMDLLVVITSWSVVSP